MESCLDESRKGSWVREEGNVREPVKSTETDSGLKDGENGGNSVH